MATTNPLTEDLPLPRFSAVAPEHVLPAVEACIAASRARIDAIVAAATPRDFDQVMAPQEEDGDRMSRLFAPVSHLHSVRDTPALREVYTKAIELLTDFETDVGQNRGLYEATRQVRDGAGFAALSRAQQTIVDDALRDFRLSGVALEEPSRSRFKEISTELSTLTTEFEQAVLDATESWHLDLDDATRLAGLPASALGTLAQYATEAGRSGYRVTLQYPSYQAVITFADDRALREEVYRAYATRASDQGPDNGKFDNSARLEKILALRHEAAQLIGFANAAEESLATKMAPSTAKVEAFLLDLVARARPVAARELAELRAFAASELGIADLAVWDTAYAAEKLRERQFHFNEEDLKPYFPAEAAINGLFVVAERAFGVRFARREGVDVWHPDVRYYDLIDADGRVFAGAYLDLYARQAKRGGAWMDVCRSRRRSAAGMQLPIAFLCCNFAPPTADAPSLLTHDDVVTLFHEFGHGLHHVLTEVDWPSVAGINGVEWDAVELPSQFMENFAWQREALDLFARHWQTNAPLPEELFAKMQAARHFHAGLFLVRQLEFGLFDLRLHRDFDPAQGSRLLATLAAVRAEVSVLPPPDWNRMPHSFTHIFSGGYSAGYYSYLWAEVLSADAFDRFERAGIFDRATGLAFRASILAVGGARPALESFVEFRGREPDATALLKSYGLAA